MNFTRLVTNTGFWFGTILAELNPNLPEDIHCFNFNAIEKIKRVRNHPCISLSGVAITKAGPNRPWTIGSKKISPPSMQTIAAINPIRMKVISPVAAYGEIMIPAGILPLTRPASAELPAGDSVQKSEQRYSRTTKASGNSCLPINNGPEMKCGISIFSVPGHSMPPPDQYDAAIAERYGKPENIEEYCRKAQLLNIETNQAMYEGWLDHMWEDASGIITWMGQSAYPSMVWQTYDYYYDLTGAFWGARKACEPLHIQWNPLTNSVKVVNTTSRDQEHLTAEVAVYNSDGSEVETLRCRQKNIRLFQHSHSLLYPFYKHVTDIASKQTGSRFFDRERTTGRCHRPQRRHPLGEPDQ